MEKFLLLEDVKHQDRSTYYCANIVEKRYECSNKLIFSKHGGFGFNYRYCSSCYDKWNLEQTELKNKCFITLE